MEITIKLDDGIFEAIRDWLKNFNDVEVTVEELKANPKVIEWIKADCALLYSETGSDGFENTDMAEELGYDNEDD